MAGTVYSELNAKLCLHKAAHIKCMQAYSHCDTQQTQNIQAMLVQCWPGVFDAGPTLHQHWLNVSWLLGGCRQEQTAIRAICPKCWPIVILSREPMGYVCRISLQFGQADSTFIQGFHPVDAITYPKLIMHIKLDSLQLSPSPRCRQSYHRDRFLFETFLLTEPVILQIIRAHSLLL